MATQSNEPTASQMIVEHLGSDATDADLEEFRGFVNALMDREGCSEREATDAVWGNGDYFGNAIRLGLVTE